MKKATITYLLSQEGQKKSILVGGDGREVQTIETDITPELLKLAHVNSDGDVTFDLSGQKVIEVELRNTDSKCWVNYSPPKLIEIQVRDGNFYDGKQRFNAPQSAKELVSWEKNRRDYIAAKKAELQPELDCLLAEFEAKMAAEEREKEERKAKREAERAEHVAREKAEKEAREKEKLDWINAHGSDYLKNAIALGYNCQRQYVTERAAMEFPDFKVDFDDRSSWNSRACPNPEALDEVKDLVEAGRKAEIVWLTDDGAEREEWEEFEPCEAIVIHDYLGRYDLINY
jgi:hypothetical protein